MRILHVGYLVDNLEKAIEDFKALGYHRTSDNIAKQSAGYTCHYMQNETNVVELITPMDDTSSIYKLFKKLGSGPYHICYESTDINEDIKKLRKKGYVVINSGSKDSEDEIHNFALLYSINIGMIELIEV